MKKNVLTIDLEEWFHVCGAEREVPPSRWSTLPQRARPSTLRLLEVLEKTKATFFVLGYVAQVDPALIREVAAAGHEIASHGTGHVRLDRLSPAEFRADLRRSVEAIGEACGERPIGYRAPEWSFQRWAIDILAEEGFEYDSSLLSMCTRGAYRIGELWEIPVMPMLNGTAIRLRSAEALSRTLRRFAPAVMALHPWQVDSDFPRIRLPLVRGILHYAGRGATEPRLRRLLSEHEFGTVRELLIRAKGYNPFDFSRLRLGVPAASAQACPERSRGG